MATDQTTNLSIILSAKDGISGVLSSLKGAFSGFGDGAAGASRELDKMAKSGAGASTAMKLVGGIAAGGVAVGIAAIGVESIKSAAKFQTMTTTLVTTAGESTKNIAMVRNGILQLSSQTGTSADKMNSAMYIIESAGYHAADGLKILKAAAQGAKAENADLAKVADAVTSSLRDYHLPATKAADVTSKLVAAVGAGKSTFEEFTGALHSVLPVASAAHVSLDDVLGSLAAMTVHGMSADQASQNLAHSIGKMQVPTQQMTDELGQLGIKSSDLNSMLGTKGISGTLEYISQTIVTKMGPAGKVMLNAFNQNKIQAADMMTMISAMPPKLQDMAKAWQAGSMTALDWKKAIKALPTDQANLMTQFTGLASKAKGFSGALKSGINTSQDYSQALKLATGDSTTMNTALMLTGENADYTAGAVKKVGQAHAEAGNNVAGWAYIQKNFNQQMDVARNTIKNTGTAIGMILLPAVTDMAKVMNAVLAPIAGWVDKHQKLTVIILGSIGAIAAVTATILTLSFALGKMKQAFDVVNIFGKGTKEVSKFGGAIDEVGKSTGKISKVTESVGKGIGGFIEGILKPLGSTAVLKGAASAALVGVAIYMIALGVNQASKDKINIANLAIMMGAMVVITGIFSLLSFLSEFAIPGAATAAIVGLGLWVAAVGISKASNLSKDISETNLLKLSAGIVTVSAILAASAGLSAFGAIGAVFDAVIGQGLVFAAEGLRKASLLAAAINPKALNDLFDLIKRVGNMNAGSLMNDLLNMVKTASMSKMAGEIQSTAVTLNKVPDVKSAVIKNVQDVVKDMGKLNTGSTIGDLLNMVKSEALSKSATEIYNTATTLNKIPNIKKDVFTNIQNALSDIDKQKFGGLLSDMENSSKAGKLVSIANNLLTVSEDLSKVKDVKKGALKDLQDAINVIVALSFGDGKTDKNNANNSKQLLDSVQNAVKMSNDISGMKKVNPSIVSALKSTVKEILTIGYGNAGTDKKNASDSKLILSAIDNLVKVSKDIANIKPVTAAEIANLDNIQKFVDKAGKMKFNVTQVTAADLSAMTNQGVALATKFVSGVKSLFSMAQNAGHQLQSSVWQAIQAQMGAEKNQGRALAESFINGINSADGPANQAAHRIQSNFWSGIQAHFGDEYNQGRSLASQVVNGIWSMQGQWWSAGDGVANGFAGGIRRNMGAINSAVGALSSAAINKLRSLLSIHSPSKVFDEIGQNVSLGMAQGIEGRSKAVADSTKSIVPTVALRGNQIVSGTATNPNANVTTATAGSMGGGSGFGNITLNVNVGAYAGQPGELNQLATVLWQQIQVIARQHNLAGNLPNIGVRPI